jgi:hypothetical protein
MAYCPYVTPEEYASLGYNAVPECKRIDALKKASRHVDSLTFNRIVGKGFANLTQFQQDIIKEVVCEQADFESENEDIINSVLSSYGINGVSMNFGPNWNMHIENGVAMKQETYSLLSQTGLCCRLVGV